MRISPRGARTGVSAAGAAVARAVRAPAGRTLIWRTASVPTSVLACQMSCALIRGAWVAQALVAGARPRRPLVLLKATGRRFSAISGVAMADR